MPKDMFTGVTHSAQGPFTSLFDIVPSDTEDLPTLTAALNVATPGQVRVTMKDGSVGDLFVVAGTLMPLRVRRIWATGTSAGGIRGLS